MAFHVNPYTQLTKDSDDNRRNFAPVIVRDKDGRLISFYSKAWYSGRLSDTYVEYSSGTLNLTVEAGNGEINGVPVTWASTPLVATPETYSMVYIDQSGAAHITSDKTMTLIQDIIILAFLNVGLTAIVNIEVVEKTGNYIFSQRQVLSGSDWVWQDYEYRLNSGEEPYASYDPLNDRVYLAYKRDGSSYVRIFDLNNPLTWEYIHHYTVTSSTINMDRPLKRTASMSVSGGVGDVVMSKDAFDMGPAAMGYKFIDGSYEPFVHLPWIDSSFVDSIIPPAYLDVYSYDGMVYTLEKTYTAVYSPYEAPKWTLWDLPPGTYYFGIRVKHRLFLGWYSTPEGLYQEFEVLPDRDYTVQGASGDYDTTIRDSIFDASTGSGVGIFTKTFESTNYFKFEEDTADPMQTGAGSGVFTKTAESSNLFEFEEDTADPMQTGAGVAVITKTAES